MNWQSMETAPKDGRFILAVEDGAWTGLPRPYIAMAYWKADHRLSDGGYWAEAARQDIWMKPSHWADAEYPSEYD